MQHCLHALKRVTLALCSACAGYEEQKQQIEEMVLLTLSYPDVSRPGVGGQARGWWAG